jgi:hypothetical protein
MLREPRLEITAVQNHPQPSYDYIPLVQRSDLRNFSPT